MTARHRFALPLLTCCLGIALVACDKEPTVTPDDTPVADAPTDDPAEAAGPALPEQDPDPAEIASAREQLELGNHEAVISTLEPVVAACTSDTQVRARAMANALLAMAKSVDLAEAGKEPSEAAIADAARLADPEVEQYAFTAHGVYLVGVQDAATAQADLEKAAAAEGSLRDFARLTLAEALLNQAFDENDKVVDPSKLDDAKAQYDGLLADTQSSAMKGRAETGLAALAKYRHDKAAICTHVAAANEHYEAASASDFIKEVPNLLGKKCK
jgi:hypothetical protein